MKWDIDKALKKFEPAIIAGTSITRVLMDVELAKKEGIPVPVDFDRTSILVWSLGIGRLSEPKQFVHGLSIRGAFLRLRKLVKARKLVLDREMYPALQKPKPKLRKHRAGKKKKV